MDAIAEVTGRATATADALLPARLVLQRYHVCDRTLDRWIADPALGFPAPLIVNKRRYFYQHQLEQWERDHARKQRVEAA
jgi:hypothetical protein